MPAVSSVPIVHLRMPRGNDWDFDFSVVDDNDPPLAVDITGWTLVFTCKLKEEDTDVLFSRSSANAGEFDIDVGSGGTATLAVVRANTKDLEARAYFYDVEAQTPVKFKTLVKGTFTVEKVTTEPT